MCVCYSPIRYGNGIAVKLIVLTFLSFDLSRETAGTRQVSSQPYSTDEFPRTMKAHSGSQSIGSFKQRYKFSAKESSVEGFSPEDFLPNEVSRSVGFGHNLAELT